MPLAKRRNKGKQGGRPETPLRTSDSIDNTAILPSIAGPVDVPGSPLNNKYDLILTSEKRRGVYECDYCRSDISQLPRIRCAVCPDFDLCLDCFVTSDHAAAVARIRAANNAHEALVEEGSASVGGSGISATAINHDDTHGYRVCESTRYPLFPAVRSVSQAPGSNSKNNNLVSSKNLSSSSLDDKQFENNLSTRKKSQPLENISEVSDTVEFDSKRDTGEILVLNKNPFSTQGSAHAASDSENLIVTDDLKNQWTVEEDLRLIEGIRSHGLGNWSDISDAVGGQGSFGKLPKRCMERYLDDFLGKYGRILPPFTFVADEAEDEPEGDNIISSESKSEETSSVRTSKRRANLLRSPNASPNSPINKKKFKVVPTESISNIDDVWPDPYLPPTNVRIGQDVCRDQVSKAEQTFVKIVSQLDETEAEKVRKHWEDTMLMKACGPTVLPMRPEDLGTLPGAELAGFMPRRGDFDVEWDNDAEQVIADMEFFPGEPQEDKELKLKVVAIYNARLDEREKRKQFILSRKLYDYRSIQAEEQKLPSDERDLVHRMRLFERFHTPEEHKIFIADLLRAKRLRKEIAKLQTYRRLGINTFAEAELYELEKVRRSFHKTAVQQNEATVAKNADNNGGNQAEAVLADSETTSSSLWKQYRTSDRKIRKSINRGNHNEKIDEADSDSKVTCNSNHDAKRETSILFETPQSVDKPLDDKRNKETTQSLDESLNDKHKKETTQSVSESPDKCNNEMTQSVSESLDDKHKKEMARSVSEPLDDKHKKEMTQSVGESLDGTHKKEMTPSAGEFLDEKNNKMTQSAGESFDDKNIKETVQSDGKSLNDELNKKSKVQATLVINKEDNDNEDSLTKMPGFNLLLPKEADLCRKLNLSPSEYQQIKTAIITESLAQGLIDKETSSSSQRTLVKIDVQQQGDILEFMVRAGWVSSKMANK